MEEGVGGLFSEDGLNKLGGLCPKEIGNIWPAGYVLPSAGSVNSVSGPQPPSFIEIWSIAAFMLQQQS